MKPKLLITLIALAIGMATNLSAAATEATKPGAALSASAKKSAEKGAVKPYPLDVCIVTDNDLGSMGEEQVMVYEGQTIKFCCKPCERKFLKNPAKYLEKLVPKTK
jgi:hypothetical protein